MNELELKLLLCVEQMAREMMVFTGWEDDFCDEAKVTVTALRDALDDLQDYRRISARHR